MNTKVPSIISKIESLSAVDGEGLRAVVFLQGCPLHCGYCHNPETQGMNFTEDVSPQELAKKLTRFLPYLKNGGVTFSGGEPLLHADYLLRTVNCFDRKPDIALETAGSVLNDDAKRLIAVTDLILLDIKAVTNRDYEKLTGGMSLDSALAFLRYLSEQGKRVWVRQVIVPGYNDTIQQVQKLGEIVRPFRPERVELLPFRKLCVSKYRELGIPFPFENYEEMPQNRIVELEKALV